MASDIVAILGSLPYIALQLKSLSMAGELLTANTPVAGSTRGHEVGHGADILAPGGGGDSAPQREQDGHPDDGADIDGQILAVPT